MAYLYRQIQIKNGKNLGNSISYCTFVYSTHPKPIFLILDIVGLNYVGPKNFLRFLYFLMQTLKKNISKIPSQ